MVDVSLPAGTLGLFKDKITKFLFLRAYQVSHEAYLERSRAGKRYESLGDFFEFDLHLESDHLSNASVPMSFLVLRNRSERSFSRIEVLVEANAQDLKYQDFTTLIDVGETPMVVYLPRIPLKDIQPGKDNRIRRTYDNVTVGITIFDDAVPTRQAKARSMRITPTFTEFLNSCWDKKWDVVWNLDYIESRKDEVRDRLRFYFCTRNQFPMEGEPHSRLYRQYKLWRQLVGRPFHWVLARDWMVAAVFWLPLFLRLRRLQP